MDPEFTYIGIGYAYGDGYPEDYGDYYTQDFGGP